MSPASASPSPSRRSGARRISLRAMCPVMIATMLPINGSRHQPRMPEIRLTTESVLVWRIGTFMDVSGVLLRGLGPLAVGGGIAGSPVRTASAQHGCHRAEDADGSCRGGGSQIALRQSRPAAVRGGGLAHDVRRGSEVELDALRERHRIGVVDRVGLAA